MKYLIQYRREGAADWMTLEPGVHGAIYKTPKVQSAIEHLTANDEVIGVALQLPADKEKFEQFNILRVPDANLHPNVFTTKQ